MFITFRSDEPREEEELLLSGLIYSWYLFSSPQRKEKNLCPCPGQTLGLICVTYQESHICTSHLQCSLRRCYTPAAMDTLNRDSVVQLLFCLQINPWLHPTKSPLNYWVDLALFSGLGHVLLGCLLKLLLLWDQKEGGKRQNAWEMSLKILKLQRSNFD